MKRLRDGHRGKTPRQERFQGIFASSTAIPQVSVTPAKTRPAPTNPERAAKYGCTATARTAPRTTSPPAWRSRSTLGLFAARLRVFLGGLPIQGPPGLLAGGQHHPRAGLAAGVLRAMDTVTSVQYRGQTSRRTIGPPADAHFQQVGLGFRLLP